MPKVSVIIPTVPGRETFLKKAINSVLNQTFQDFEILVITSGKLNYHPNDPRILILELPNSNVSQARNYGIKNSKGEFVAFLDDDDEWLPTKLEKQLYLMESNPEIGLCYTNFYKAYLNGQTIVNQASPCGGYCYEQIKRKNIIGTSTAMVKKDILLDTGLFDEKLTFAEDWDLWIRIAKDSKIAYIPEPLVIYHIENEKRKYCLYFIKFHPFVSKWKKKIEKDTLISHILIWIWYGKECGKFNLTTYWMYKIGLITGLLSPDFVIKTILHKLAKS